MPTQIKKDKRSKKLTLSLPKGFKHWCKKAGLRPHQGSWKSRKLHEKWRWYSLRGKGRYWRVNCFGEFSVGDVYREFDRWANSSIKNFPMPKTEAEFLNLVGRFNPSIEL